MPHNPFGNPLFLQATWRVLLLLVIGLAAVVAAERKPLRVLRRSTLFLRARTWFWVAPLFLLSLFIGGFVLVAVAAYVTVQAVSEYVRMTGVQRGHALLLVLWSSAGPLLAWLAPRYFPFLPFGFFILLTVVAAASREVADARRQVTGALFGYLYIGLPMAYVIAVRTSEAWGLQFVLIVGVAVALSDVAAVAVDSALKGPRLAPRVSATKTWAGTLGNLVGAGAAVALLLDAVPKAWTPAGVVALVVALAVGSVCGDLTQGLVRRDFAVRAAGSLLPGFGFVLDRIDSLLLALPLAYYALVVTNHLVRA